MTTLLDRIDSPPGRRPADADRPTPAQRLRATMAAARVSFTWLGTQKSLTARAERPGRRGVRRRGPVPLRRQEAPGHPPPGLPRRHGRPRPRSPTYWKGMSLPYPEPGVRLIRQDQVEEFAAPDGRLPVELDDAVRQPRPPLRRAEAGRRRAARARCINPADYPETLVGLFDVAVGLPQRRAAGLPACSSARPSTSRSGPAWRRGSRRRCGWPSRRSRGVRPAGRRTCAERITGAGEDGQPKVFRDSAVDNLSDFFGRFRELNVRSNEQLDELVERAQRAVRGVGGAGPARQPGAAPAGGGASSRRSSRRWTGCWSSGPGGASCGRRPRRGRRDAPGRSTPAAACAARLRRGDRPGRARPPRHRPRQPRRARPPRPLDGRPPARSAGRCSAPSAAAARPWRPSVAWLEAHWLTPPS